ncbi:MAG: 5-methyltetrahydropteroyltriglutamate--homocysteine S-methyltransferase [Verrucomicrobia bacterium]|nr:MAG: 5-methyltetrahydropteroyltriglutamate--homocysteine S-methyltransferase [Verrucomicrobiota bacterium]
MKILTHNLGFPRIGANRELKKAVEGYWAGRVEESELLKTAHRLRVENWRSQATLGIDLVPSNDFSLYDQVLDMTCILGNLPERFQWASETVTLEQRFQLARGGQQSDMVPCEMKKWFDTNYHYIVPEFSRHSTFRLADTKPVQEFGEALQAGIRTKPVLLGPLTYLALGKSKDRFDRFEHLNSILPIYEELLSQLAQKGAEWVQIDEPILVQDLPENIRGLFLPTYQKLTGAAPGLKLLLATYFGELRENLPVVASLPVQAVHLDCVRGGAELPAWIEALPKSMNLSLGIVNGRNIWKTDFAPALDRIEHTLRAIDAERLFLAPSCSLLHVPISLRQEGKLARDLYAWLAFAEEKLDEIQNLARLAVGNGDLSVLHRNEIALQSRKVSARSRREELRQELAKLQTLPLGRQSPFEVRKTVQREKLGLPVLPVTTIGSFPQTPELRSVRAGYKKGQINSVVYERYIEQEIATAIALQERVGLDVFVHGEFERNDMVEYFGEQLEGFAFTANGWVQSYGTRCVKPPIIFGDVWRPHPMTVRWSTYAQSLTKFPVKGMLTGPITMIQWSFVRDDQPHSETAMQIAYALREEVLELEKNGISVIQIDEPALREGLPLRRADAAAYLAWAVRSFQACFTGVSDGTQIHTHMCYSEFPDIIDAIKAMDADVISIEASRSEMELIEFFVDYINDIGLGIYDVHSPAVPTVEFMEKLLRKAVNGLSADKIWVNPDCGLKTRRWEEVTPALQNLVRAAQHVRNGLLKESLVAS